MSDEKVHQWRYRFYADSEGRRFEERLDLNTGKMIFEGTAQLVAQKEVAPGVVKEVAGPVPFTIPANDWRQAFALFDSEAKKEMDRIRAEVAKRAQNVEVADASDLKILDAAAGVRSGG